MRHIKFFPSIAIFIFILGFASLLTSAYACSLALWKDKKLDVYVGRTMSWESDMATDLFIFPRGISQDGSTQENPNPIKWTSRYGSIVARNFMDAVTTDGMNEKGFAAHVLWQTDADFGTPDHSKPGLSVLAWAQYYLDNYATVQEAIDDLAVHPYQIEPYFIPDPVALHLAIEDATGDSAVLEIKKGQVVYHHNRKSPYVALTNQPEFDEQLANLRQYQAFGGKLPLPGSANSLDRFVRSTYFVSNLPEPTNNDDAISEILSVMDNVAEPYGLIGPERASVSHTVWRTVTDLTHHDYYFQNMTGSRSLVWVHLDQFDLSPGDNHIYMLSMDSNPALQGDITSVMKGDHALKKIRHA